MYLPEITINNRNTYSEKTEFYAQRVQTRYYKLEWDAW